MHCIQEESTATETIILFLLLFLILWYFSKNKKDK